MHRITVSLPDEQVAALGREARRRRTSVSDVVRVAVMAHLHQDGPRTLPFAALGRGANLNTARDAEEILAREWPDDIRRDR